MTLPSTVARRRQEEDDAAVRTAAWKVISAQNARRLNTTSVTLREEVVDAVANLRKVVLRQDQEQ